MERSFPSSAHLCTASDNGSGLVRQAQAQILDNLLGWLIIETLGANKESFLQACQRMVAQYDWVCIASEELLCESGNLQEEGHDILTLHCKDFTEDIEGGDLGFLFGDVWLDLCGLLCSDAQKGVGRLEEGSRLCSL
jgi:hypothetical protein